LLLAGALILLASCGVGGQPAPAAPVVEVRNVDGPEVAIRVGGREIKRVECQSTVTIDEATAGSLPWDLDFIGPDGNLLGTVHESTNDFRPYVVVRADGIVSGDAPAIGPAPVGCP
jgi:hypothetical protein